MTEALLPELRIRLDQAKEDAQDYLDMAKSAELRGDDGRARSLHEMHALAEVHVRELETKIADLEKRGERPG